MFSKQFQVAGDFPPASYAQWRAMVENDLTGAPFDEQLVNRLYDGIAIEPLYTQPDTPVQDEMPSSLPGTHGAQLSGRAGGGWDIRPQYMHPELDAANQAIRDDLAGGCSSLLLRFDGAARQGIDPGTAGDLAGADGLMVYQLNDLQRLLREVSLERISIHLQPGGAFLPAAAMLIALWQARGLPGDRMRGAFGGDPLGALAGQGSLPSSVDTALAKLGELASWTARHCPHVTAVGVDTSVYHDAGATAVQDIACAAATATEYLRALTAAGLSVDQVARQFLFTFSVGTHHFRAVARLRAARRVWARILEASGGTPSAGAMRIHARTAGRVLTQRDPYINLLRNAAAMFAAGIGGAEVLTPLPLDCWYQYPDELSRRIARNSVLVLQEEGNLHRVADPAGGSWFIERLTDELASSAWGVFQEIERQGGMASALQSGWIAEQIEPVAAARARDIAHRQVGILGVTEFPDLEEKAGAGQPLDMDRLRSDAAERLTTEPRGVPPVTESSGLSEFVSAAAAGASIGQMARALGFGRGAVTIESIVPRRLAQPFEQLRDASDAWQTAHGRRPMVCLAAIAPPAHSRARVNYAKNFFEAGGFEAIISEELSTAGDAVAAFRHSGAAIAVLCASDGHYTEIVAEIAPQLKAAGARSVVLAGHPGENEQAWRAAGVDRFIFTGCDVLSTLRELLVEQGVLAS